MEAADGGCLTGTTAKARGTPPLVAGVAAAAAFPTDLLVDTVPVLACVAIACSAAIAACRLVETTAIDKSVAAASSLSFLLGFAAA
jgi:hypothetical protein